MYFKKKPVHVHPVFSLPNRKGLMVECIKLDEAKVVPEEKIKMILAVLAHLMELQRQRNPKTTIDPFDEPDVDYKHAYREHWHTLLGLVNKMELEHLFVDQAGDQLTDKQLTEIGGMGNGQTHALHTVLMGTAGGFGRDEWREHQQEQENQGLPGYQWEAPSPHAGRDEQGNWGPPQQPNKMWYQKKDPAPIAPSQPASSWEDIPEEEYRNISATQAGQLMGFAPMEDDENDPAPPCAGQSIPEENDAEMPPQPEEDWELQNAINEVLDPDLR